MTFLFPGFWHRKALSLSASRSSIIPDSGGWGKFGGAQSQGNRVLISEQSSSTRHSREGGNDGLIASQL